LCVKIPQNVLGIKISGVKIPTPGHIFHNNSPGRSVYYEVSIIYYTGEACHCPGRFCTR